MKVLPIRFQLLPRNCPLISRALLVPWRLFSLFFGLGILICGSIWSPSEDWDIPICFAMGVPAYFIAPWSFRQLFYGRWKWWFAAVFASWFSIDGTYSLYCWITDFSFLEQFRLANFIYCLPIFLLSGFVWNLDITRRVLGDDKEEWHRIEKRETLCEAKEPTA